MKTTVGEEKEEVKAPGSGLNPGSNFGDREKQEIGEEKEDEKGGSSKISKIEGGGGRRRKLNGEEERKGRSQREMMWGGHTLRVGERLKKIRV